MPGLFVGCVQRILNFYEKRQEADGNAFIVERALADRFGVILDERPGTVVAAGVGHVTQGSFMIEVNRVQTGVRMEASLLKVLN